MSGHHRLATLAFFLLSLLSTGAFAQVTELVSKSTAGVQGNGSSILPSVTDDGRFVVFNSDATNLVPSDTNAVEDVFVRDRIAGTTERLSVSTAGVQGNGDSFAQHRAITPDGRYVVFASTANNLAPGDAGTDVDIFVRDRQTNTTELVSVSSVGQKGNGDSEWPSISADGRYVAFHSSATNLVIGDANGKKDVFVRDRTTGTTSLVSLPSPGQGLQLNGDSTYPRISLDGTLVAFLSAATNAVAGDTNGFEDVYLRNLVAGTTERMSFDDSGNQFNGPCHVWIDITADDNYVGFSVSGSSVEGIYVRDRTFNADYPLAYSSDDPQFGGSGLFLALITWSPEPGDTNGVNDVYVWDAINAVGGRESVSSAGAQGNGASGVYGCGVTPDRRYVVFDSQATNFVASDANGAQEDIFIRDRMASSFTSLCHPGVDGIRTCPCGNPPSSAGRGCNNSASTGGAMLSASGAAYLSTDSLVFTTSGERPTATSTLWQGPGASSTGVVFGQAVRCASGTLKRLYNKSAVGGSITAPGAGDPSVSARSAAKGDVISTGQSRYYFVSYRDPTVLGGCPVTSTFSATQTGRVVWSF